MISLLAERLGRRRRVRAGALRWGIKIGAPEGPKGDRWGDVPFAHDLAAALRRRGQIVHVDRLGARERPSAEWADDVTLVLRGLIDHGHVPGTISYLWVISHPDHVRAPDLGAGWDRVFAASLTWPGDERPHAPVEPLLQATAPDRFRPGAPSPELAHDVLFVGTSRRVPRRVILDAVDVGADLSVYGHDWEPFLPAGMIRDQHLSNARLPDAYRSARRVLNDHWDDMIDAGFVSNRLFDAVASGARVVSDDIAGLDELFTGAARSYRDLDELKTLLDDDAGWPDDAEMRRIAARVGAEHSFDARAARLVEAATGDLRARQRGVLRVVRDAVSR